MKNAAPDAEWTPKMLDKVRQARAKHLIEVFGITTRFEANQTGLPEPTALSVSPSSLTQLYTSASLVLGLNSLLKDEEPWLMAGTSLMIPTSLDQKARLSRTTWLLL